MDKQNDFEWARAAVQRLLVRLFVRLAKTNAEAVDALLKAANERKL